jgi:hypothetical protein
LLFLLILLKYYLFIKYKFFTCPHIFYKIETQSPIKDKKMERRGEYCVKIIEREAKAL